MRPAKVSDIASSVTGLAVGVALVAAAAGWIVKRVWS